MATSSTKRLFDQAVCARRKTGSYMAVETQHYEPWIKHTESMGCNAWKLKVCGKCKMHLWEVLFITHFIQDTISNRILAIECFLFNPGQDKGIKCNFAVST